jgi:group I intron endonuclease
MTIGIYCIQNVLDGKRYIGKSKQVEKRLKDHRRSLLKPRHKDINRYLHAAVSFYGIENFTFTILEAHDVLDEAYLADRELHFMDEFNTCDRECGYNLRRDSSTNTVVHEETRKLISESNKGYSNPNYGNRWTPEMKEAMSLVAQGRHKAGVYGDEWKAKVSKAASLMWQDEDKKQRMAKKVAETKSSLRFYEYDKKTGELLHVWESMSAILEAHPDYFRIAIYNVCNGHKKSYRGSVWVSETKQVEDSDDLSGHRNKPEARQDMAMCNKEGAGDKALEEQ